MARVRLPCLPFDEIAVEEALRLRERHGGEVIAVAIGTERFQVELRAARAMGADRAILVRHCASRDVRRVLVTHGHWTTAAARASSRSGAGTRLETWDLELEVLHMPGHTPGLLWLL